MPYRPVAPVLAALALALGACGGGDDDDAEPAGSGQPSTGAEPAPEATLTADPSGELAFEPDRVDAKPGQLTIRLENPSSVPHAIAIRGGGVLEQGRTVERGGTSEVTVTLRTGSYDLYCPVPGHEQGGMTGSVRVE